MGVEDDSERDGDAASPGCVAFVDLVRFTSLTEVHGDLAGADAAETLYDIASARLGDQVRLIKTLGDGVLLLASAPGPALKCTAQIVEALHDLANGSDARAGLHHGAVLERQGDIFGSTVNMASRIVSVAQPGTIAVTRRVAQEAGALGLASAPLGLRPVRGFAEEVELFQINPCEHGGTWLADPVCGMRVDAEGASAVMGDGSDSYGFCSVRCAELFDAAPHRYL